MTDRVTVFSPRGYPLGEIDAAVSRSSQLERTVNAGGKGQLSISADDPKATFNLLRYGNFIFCEPDNGLPDWAGMIWPRTHSQNGILKLTLLSCEWMLGIRKSDNNDKCLGNVAQVFLYMLHLANRRFPLPLSSRYVISEPGDTADRVLNAELIIDAINKLAEDTDNYWWLEPLRRNDGRLEFVPHLENKVGRNLTRPLVEGVDIGEITLTEEPTDLANVVYGFGRFDDWRDPIEYEAINPIGMGLFGPMEGVESFLDIDTAAGLIAPVRAKLRRRGMPYLAITATYTGSGAPPRPGDRVPIQFAAEHGYITRRRPLNIPMTVTSLEYEPEGDNIVFTATEFTDE